MSNIVLISGHPNLDDSIANQWIMKELQHKIEDVEIVRLDMLYPNYEINVLKEQERLVTADIIIIQYPLFWYSMPSLLVRYFEQILSHGFSHGSRGDKLQNKILIASFTSGAKEEVYDGMNQYRIDEFLAPIQATCKLCGMHFGGYVYTGGVSYHDHHDDEKCLLIQNKAKKHADKLIALLESI